MVNYVFWGHWEVKNLSKLEVLVVFLIKILVNYNSESKLEKMCF